MEADIIALFAVSNFKKFGKRLESLRKSKNLTQNRLCLKSGVSKNSISAYECHKRSPPKNTVKKLAKGLNVHSALLEDHSEFYERAPEYLCNFDPETGKFNLSREE
jgi:transcriptional regulator with XRE-family HTH domain